MFQVIRTSTIGDSTPTTIISNPRETKAEAITTAIIYADSSYRDLITVTTRIIVTPRMYRS